MCGIDIVLCDGGRKRVPKPCYPSGRRGRGPSAASYREAMTKMPMGGIVSSPTPVAAKASYGAMSFFVLWILIFEV